MSESGGTTRNVAVVAHVDHGKTTLIDAMLWQSEVFGALDYDAERVIDSIDLEREKQIAVLPPLTSLTYRGTRINVVDVPCRAGFGGDAERALRMVEGLLLLVDAGEGPVPQTRFALRNALEAGLAPIVVLTKIDRPDARPAAVLGEVRELFAELESGERARPFPVLYTNARHGICRREPAGRDEPLLPLFDEIVRAIPAPGGRRDEPLHFLVTAIEYDDFLGRMARGRLFAGELRPGARAAHHGRAAEPIEREIGVLLGCRGTERVAVASAGPGDIVAVTGIAAVRAGDRLAACGARVAPAPFEGDEPVLEILVEVNDSPTVGFDGTHVSAAELRERLWRELLTNDGVRIEETDSPDAFRLAARGELELVMLVEMMRREGYELLAGPPRAILREAQGVAREPMEALVLDCPEGFVGVVTAKAGARRARLTKMVNQGTGRVRLEFRAPARGLVGFRAEFLSDTKGSGILYHRFDGYDDWAGAIPARVTGSLVADRAGRASTRAIEHLQGRGTMFVAPGDHVYRGMIVGENSKANDLAVDVTKAGREPRQEPGAGPARTVALIPPRSMSLDQALEFVRDDERVEVTPRALRLRKKELRASEGA